MPASPTAGPFTLDEIAKRCGGTVVGDGRILIRQVNTLENAGDGELAFLSNPKYRGQVEQTRASGIVLSAEHASLTTVSRIVSEQPYLTYARAATLLNPTTEAPPGVHPRAEVDARARIAPTASIGPNAVIGHDAEIGDGCVIHPGAVVGARVSLGARTIIHANAVLYADTQVGSDCVIHAGAVLGADGFGMAETPAGWLKIPQIGRVVVGERVDIGANTTIDRGALDDTVIEDGVKLDNLIQIGHNVRVGAHTIMAACVGVAGSADIGPRCMIGGAALIAGHLRLVEGVHITAGSFVMRSILKPGRYSGVFPIDDNAAWEKNAATLRQLHTLRDRLRALEKNAGRSPTP
jgi:UDP-3-O-[3-hydroxymyristoyl] glucosamine N-acyltransferase